MPAFKGSVMRPAPGRNPAHFGEIRGFPVGSRWPGRRELCDDGVHAPLTGGIHGRMREGAFSVVLSGGYDDDIDLGNEFTYTGQGGQSRREKGVRWDNVQIKDQEWTRGNLALAISWRTKKVPL
ncbi:SRA-YDG [Pholiota conissans]|uniref:SRA-YDG n=1 Tax=Pholiota conissans TaxID=109636 RepID=A0A9P5YSJ4_9AGAR|nr:SRA-YDG [Pholiota conissans]